jgi:hypothetical protein
VDAFNTFFSIALSAAGLTSDLEQGGIVAWLKQRGLDRAARAWTLRGMSVARSHATRSDLLVLSEHATPSTLLPSAAILRGWESVSSGALVADPRALRFWRSQGVPVMPLVTSPANERRLLGSARRQFDELWRRFERNPPDLHLGATSVTAIALPILRRQLARTVPWLAVEKVAVREALQEIRPSVVLLASDQHRLGSMVVDESHTNDFATVVMQHGLPQHAIGYVPVGAHKVLTWSEQSRNWFTARGAPASRLVVTGNPAFDAAWVDRQERSGAGGAVRLLLALTPVTASVNAAVVAMALDAVAVMPNASLVVKLHPGDGDWGYVRQLVQDHAVRDRVRVAHKEPLAPLLLDSSVTWLHRSSVALESLAVGVPVIVTAASTPSTADLELRGLRLPVASSPSQLASMTSSLVDATGRSTYFVQRPIESFAGPLDGQASKRARNAILALMPSLGLRP